MNIMNPRVDEYFSKVKKWQDELETLRMIILDCGLTEELKWAVPCYTWHGKNIVGLNGLKEYCALAFFKGALLSDEYGILIQPGKVQAGRYIRFTNVGEIVDVESILKAYIFEAVEVEKAGLKPDQNTRPEIPIPAELRNKFEKMPDLKTAFESLTPGRQRAYRLYFSQPKQSKTRVTRIEKFIEQILDGKGLNDM